MNAFFSNTAPVVSASAPGRMDVMGGIADYSGSLLLQMPIAETTQVSVQLRNDGIFHLRTELSEKSSADFVISYSELKEKNYAEAGGIIKLRKNGDWAAYIIGCFLVLEKEKNIQITGAAGLIKSDIPWGKGVSSSAALEVATMNALDKLYSLRLDKTELPLLAQMAENFVVGAPCGLMDQLSSHLGQKNKLLPLVCQPHDVLEALILPEGVSFSGIDSGIRHAVSGASYTDVRAAAFMAYTVIALHEGATFQQLEYARQNKNRNELPFKGFLANISVAEFENKYSGILPETISGKDFFEKYVVSIDTATIIEPSKQYKLKACAAHPVYENFRVHQFKNLLQNFSGYSNSKESLIKLGELMLQSHAGYSAVGLGNKYTDDIVAMVCEDGPGKNIYGARITGGGSGGTVCVLSFGKKGEQSVKEIYKRYIKRINKKVYFFTGSSEGALALNNAGMNAVL